MSKVGRYFLFIGLFFLVLLPVLGGSASASAAEAARGISLSTTYTELTIVKTQSVTLPIKVANLSKVDEQVSIEISSAPRGWVTDLVNVETGLSFQVRGMHLAVDEARLIYFRAKPPADVKQGDYLFVVEAASQDELVKTSLAITIGIEEQATALSRVKLTAIYPDLAGPAGDKFEFKVSVSNQGSEDRLFTFSAEAPPRWEVFFRPAFEQKLIAALGVKAGESTDMEAEVVPPIGALTGTYTTKLKATSGDIEGTIDLKVTLKEAERGVTYELELLPTNSRLDIEATAGKASNLTVLVTNRGSGILDTIRFFGSTLEGWLITFSPEKIDLLRPGEAQEVSVFITPSRKTIAGDYSLTIRGNAVGVADSVDLRVRVGQSTIWGWVGLAIVLLVIAAMVTLFWRLGRR